MLNYPLVADTVVDMSANILPDGWSYKLLGNTVKFDQPPVWYVYDINSTATPDGVNVIIPTMITAPAPGRYIKKADSYTALTDLPGAPSFTTPTRSLSTTGSNNTYTISTTRNALATYIINFSAALTLTTSNGKVTLDYSLNGGSTWVTVASVSQVFGVSITITTNTDNVLSGMIPANALVRINRVTNTNVTIALSANQQEVLF